MPDCAHRLKLVCVKTQSALTIIAQRYRVSDPLLCEVGSEVVSPVSDQGHVTALKRQLQTNWFVQVTARSTNL